MTKAIIGHGEYQLRSEYSFLAVSEDKWFQMSQQQRLHWINKFNACQVQECARSCTSDPTHFTSRPDDLASSTSRQNNMPDISFGRFAVQDNSSLSVSVQDMVKCTKLPYTSVEGMWRKACRLVTEINAVVCAPGLGEKDKMVKSQSGSSPHLVVVKAAADGLQYKCDDKCPHHKSVGICSHVIAAAETNGDLQRFLEWLCCHGRQAPNLTNLSTHGMPSGAGKKGGKAPRKKAVNLSDENRVPLDTLASGCSTGNVNVSVCQKSSNSSPAACNAIFNASEVSHMTNFNNYVPTSSSWPAFVSPPNAPYIWPNFNSPSKFHSPPNFDSPPYIHSPWAWSQSISPLQPPPPTPLSMYAPPMQQYESQPPDVDQFKVCSKTGNISVCNGCRNKFKTCDTIVIQHQEFRGFTNPHSGLPSSKLGNAYYHLSRKCIEYKFGYMHLNIVILDDAKPKLTSVHKQILSQEFSITL